MQELEYPDGHTSRSIYVAMPITGLGPDVPVEAWQHVQGAHLAIWTTTPWTIPANAAVAVNAELLYAVVQAEVQCLLAWPVGCCTLRRLCCRAYCCVRTWMQAGRVCCHAAACVSAAVSLPCRSSRWCQDPASCVLGWIMCMLQQNRRWHCRCQLQTVTCMLALLFFACDT